MDSYSDSESSVVEENKVFDSVNPTLEDPFPVKSNNSQFLPSADQVKLPSSAKSKLKLLFGNKTVQKIHNLLFWLVFYKKLKPESTARLQEITSKQLSEEYVKLLLSSMSQSFNSLLDLLPIFFGHAINHEYFDLFPNSRHQFDLRFILDCYKIIYLELSGILVTDIFIQNLSKQILGDYFLHYQKIRKKKPENASPSLNKKLEKQMTGVPGGLDFAKELAERLRPTALKRLESRQTDESAVKLGVSDTILAEKVNRHLSEKLLKASNLSDNSKVFNCNKLSPLISRQINSSTNEIPYKQRYVTPHKVEQVKEKHPMFLRILQKHCEDKQKNSKKIIDKDPRFGKVGNSSKNVEISPLGPAHSPCFYEVFKLKNKLNEFDHAKVLLGERSRVKL